MIDEGVSVLYNTISELIHKGDIKDGEEYKALIIDCGGGTTDLCSCSFRVWDRRVSYQIEIMTAYENGDTDFGGNNLTYRIMQLLKITLALPYRITAFTHNGDEVVLIHRLKRGSAMISRNMENLTLKLYLKDLEGKERYQYTGYTTLTDFTEMSYEQIQAEHGEHIRQKDTEDIVENEVKFFV